MSCRDARIGNPRWDLGKDVDGDLRPLELHLVELDQLGDEGQSLGMQLLDGVRSGHETWNILAGGDPALGLVVPDGANHDGSKHSKSILLSIPREYRAGERAALLVCLV